MTQVLVTGGTGFIGSRLAIDCHNRGESVRVLAQKNSEVERANCLELQSNNIAVAEGSVLDSEVLEAACAGVDIVYHLAAAQHEANVPDKYYYDVNVEGTRNVLIAATKSGVRRFMHGSTIGVYGSKKMPVSEDSALEPDNIYGITKLEAEDVVREFLDKLPVTILRISETYGPGDRRLLKLFKGIAKRKFFHVGTGRNLHHPVYIDDLISGMRQAAEQQDTVGKTMVLAGPRALTTNEMVTGISKVLNVAVPKIRLPMWPLMASAIAMEKTLSPIGIQPPLHRRRMNFFKKSFRFDCGEARSSFGYKPTIDFDDGAKRTAAWYRQKKML